MKRILTAISLFSLCAAAFAQDNLQQALDEAAQAIENAEKVQEAPQKPNYWKTSAVADLGFNQTSLTNWAAGGYNTLNLSAAFDAQANYSKKLMNWGNRLQLNYAFLWSADKVDLIQKSADRIYLESKWTYRTGENSKWNYSASYDFRSQFTDTKDKYVKDEITGKWDGTLKSSFFAPAYTNVALGMDWKPSDWFDVSLAPLTGGFTICNTEILRPNYGMKLIEEGMDPEIGANYRSALFQFGAQLKANARWTINDVFGIETQLVLFTDYLNHPFTWTRVNWDNKISWQLGKYFKVCANTWLIYDPIVLIKDDAHPDGTQMIQFKEFLSFNFTYTFKSLTR